MTMGSIPVLPISRGSGMGVTSQKGGDGTSRAFSWRSCETDTSQGVHKHGYEGLFLKFIPLFIDSFFHSLIHSSDMYGGPTVSTAFVGIVREGFIGEVTFEQREPCLASRREPHG